MRTRLIFNSPKNNENGNDNDGGDNNSSSANGKPTVSLSDVRHAHPVESVVKAAEVCEQKLRWRASIYPCSLKMFVFSVR